MNRFSFFILNYGSALLSGGVQFIAMTWFARSLESQSYSLLAWSFSLFPQFQLLLDLGLQNELVRRFSQGSVEQKQALFREALALRLLMACGSFGVFFVQAFFAGIDAFHAVASCFFLLSLLPAAVFYTFEAEGYASGMIGRTILMRLGRLLGFAMVLLTYVVALDNSKELGPKELIELCMVYPLGWLMVLLVFVLLRKKKKQGGPQNSSMQHFEPLLRPTFSFDKTLQLLRSAKEYVAAFFFSWLTNALFTIGITRWFGESKLGGFFFAQTLCVPVALALQVLSGLTIAGLAKNSQSKSEIEIENKDSPRRATNWKAAWLAATFASIIYAFIITETPLLERITSPQIASDARSEFLLLICSQLAMAAGGILGVRLFAQGHKASVWICTAGALPVCAAVWAWFWLGKAHWRQMFPASFDYFLIFSTPFLLLLFVTLDQKRKNATKFRM